MDSGKETKLETHDDNVIAMPEPNVKYLSNLLSQRLENDTVDPRISIIQQENKSANSLSPVLGRTQIYFTLFKGMVGIGFLYLPLGYSYAGAVFSILAFLVCSFFSSEGFNRLISAHERAGGSYSELAEKAGGRVFKAVLEVSLVISQVRRMSP